MAVGAEHGPDAVGRFDASWQELRGHGLEHGSKGV